jgi:hypothetical protein
VKLATQSCDRCGLPVVPVTAHNRRVYLDPAVPVFLREFDPDNGVAFWTPVEPLVTGERWVLAQHICRGQAAGEN